MIRVLFIVAMLPALFSPALSDAPGQVVVESATTRLIVAIENGRAHLAAVENPQTGESIRFDPESADFVISTDQGEVSAKELTVTGVLSNDRVTYITMDGAKLCVTQRFEVFDSGCIKRSLELFAKEPVFIEKVSLVDLRLAAEPRSSVNHQARFLVFERGGVFITVEMPMPSRNIRLDKDRHLQTVYEPRSQLNKNESYHTVPAVFAAWNGKLLDGFDAYRDYTYELSGWREYAAVRASSETPPALTTAYDAYKAVDDDPTTRWRSQRSASGTHWLEIELPEAARFDTMELVLDNPQFRPVLERVPVFRRWRLQIWTGNDWADAASGSEPPSAPVRFPEVRAKKIRFLVEGCVEPFSIWDLKLYLNLGESVIPENVCSRFCVSRGIRMPFTYFNTWYIRHPGIGRLQRARGLLTYDKVLPLIPLAADCGLDCFVLDSGWKYQWYGVGLNPRWEIEFPYGEKPFADAARQAGITLAGWFNFFWLEGESRDLQWRAVKREGTPQRQMCLLSGYYDFVKKEMLSQIRNNGMLVMKIDGFVPPDECWANDHNHKPGPVRDATWLKFMQLVEELKRQYPALRLGIYTWDPFWLKYSELVHTYEDHGGLTPGELAPTRAKMNFMHDREMFNEAYWRYLVWNQIEGSAIISDKTPEWKEELIGNLACSTRRQISTDLGTFTAEERNWIRSCLDWSRRNAAYLECFRPFFPNQKVSEPWGLQRCRDLEKGLGIDVLECNTLEGYAHINHDEGYVFVFNPTFQGAEYEVPISSDLGFSASAANLHAQVIYPYFEDLSFGTAKSTRKLFGFGDIIRGWLPAQKHIVIRIRKAAIRPLVEHCRYVVKETIWDSVELEIRAEPRAGGGSIKTKLVPPEGVVFERVVINGKPSTPSQDGTYEISLTVPQQGNVSVHNVKETSHGAKKSVTADIRVSGDLRDGQLMLFLLRSIPNGKQRTEKAEPGDLDFRLTVNDQTLEGALGDTLEKDWETDAQAGWWHFRLPEGLRAFKVGIECSEKVQPVLVYSAVQESNTVEISAYYSRESNKRLLTCEDPEAFFHDSFPVEREYFPIVKPSVLTERQTN
ncbi:MAG: hypothetical protein QHI38_06570 [Armatimonadota bacterium]|nr:hypothetical protein [Armatimonadota bacterium]